MRLAIGRIEAEAIQPGQDTTLSEGQGRPGQLHELTFTWPVQKALDVYIKSALAGQFAQEQCLSFYQFDNLQVLWHCPNISFHNLFKTLED